MIPSIVFSILFIVLAIILLMGKGDMLIAGYNTASEEERNKIDIKRLRIVMVILMVITAVFCAILPLLIGNNKTSQLAAAGLFIAITIVGIIVANTWAKKK